MEKERTKVYYYFGIFVGISSALLMQHFYPDGLGDIALWVVSILFLLVKIVKAMRHAR
jgi:hypothetical protein